MPLPPGHERERHAAHLSARERRLIRIVGAVAAALIIAILVSLVVRGQSSGDGCVRATIAGPVGAEQIVRCGAAARELCHTLGPAQGLSPEAVQTVATECRKAGLRVGG